MAENVEPTAEDAAEPKTVLDLQDLDNEVEAHNVGESGGGGNCISVLSVVN